MKISFAVIGGTGVYDPKNLIFIKDEEVTTPYGVVTLKIGKLQDKLIAFLARHGQGHSVPPHRINYRANIFALKKLGVKKIIATAAVGSLKKEFSPGQLVLIDQFIDFTKNRVQTFYEGQEGVLHVDLSEPYCPHLRKTIFNNCPKDIKLGDKGTYVCTEGPRFETPAEIKMFAKWGGDLVGMTSVPEVVLARELGMCYASIAMVTNYAAGISTSPLTHAEVKDTMRNNANNLQKLLTVVLKNLTEEQNCTCFLANQEVGTLGKEG